MSKFYKVFVVFLLLFSYRSVFAFSYTSDPSVGASTTEITFTTDDPSATRVYGWDSGGFGFGSICDISSGSCISSIQDVVGVSNSNYVEGTSTFYYGDSSLWPLGCAGLGGPDTLDQEAECNSVAFASTTFFSSYTPLPPLVPTTTVDQVFSTSTVLTDNPTQDLYEGFILFWIPFIFIIWLFKRKIS